MPSKTRQRELARLRAKRELERRRLRRRRALVIYGAFGILVAAAAAVGGVMLASRPQSKPSASPATATTAPTASTAAPTGARVDAPSAPATVACGGKLPPRHAHPTAKSAPTQRLRAGRTYLAQFKTSCGEFTVRLDPASAPIAAANFVSLAQKGFYDSTWFHRILAGSGTIGVIQGGDPQGTGQGGPGYTIKDEPPKGKAPYAKYTIAMAKSSTPNSAGSQFYINTKDNNDAGWNRAYAVFGKVVAGQSVVDKIGKVPVGGQNGDTPTQAVWIEKLTIKVS
ncbi:MAG TPA: peptidylprolyl isomerase [Actinomycetes bacterium]|nr:peptidylprolyl isomerase [Actinomycetes bacterium]